MLDSKEFLKTNELHPQRDHERVAYFQYKLDFETDSWDLNQAIKRGEKVIIIDARSKAAYENEHIPDAINFPWRSINRESAKASLNQDMLYVTYCDGIGCNASTKSALKLAQLGYKVKELIGGIDWWKRDKYPTTGKSVSE